MNRKPCKTAENHAPTVRKTMGGTVAKQQPDTTMTDNSADNDSTETTDNNDTPTANGFELDSVAAVANAFEYLDDPYNAGYISVRSSEDLVIIQSRGAHFGHMYSLLEAKKQGHISIQSITAGTDRDGDPCLRIEVVGGDESDDDDTPTVKGVELDSVVGVANAFEYLDKMYNAGHITVRSSEDLVILQSRRTHFRYMGELLEAQKQGHISIQHISTGTNRVDDPCLNIEFVGGDE
jgi:hypothetical protein